jgi:ketosteroid isomerase-like protein
MSDRDAILFANEAFYRAFAGRDVDAMAALWADDVPVACVHPGWPPIYGRDEVLKSWAAIIGNASQPEVRCHEPRPFITGAAGFVLCYEEVGGQYLLATNVFVRHGAAWRMVHHQSGPTAGKPAPSREPPHLRVVN